LNGNPPPHFGIANLAINRNAHKNRSIGKTCSNIFSKTLCLSNLTSIKTLPVIDIHRSCNEELKGFLDSNIE
jgi:hypothetical protein